MLSSAIDLLMIIVYEICICNIVIALMYCLPTTIHALIVKDFVAMKMPLQLIDRNIVLTFCPAEYFSQDVLKITISKTDEFPFVGLLTVRSKLCEDNCQCSSSSVDRPQLLTAIFYH